MMSYIFFPLKQKPKDGIPYGNSSCVTNTVALHYKVCIYLISLSARADPRVAMVISGVVGTQRSESTSQSLSSMSPNELVSAGNPSEATKKLKPCQHYTTVE